MVRVDTQMHILMFVYAFNVYPEKFIHLIACTYNKYDVC
jgi:hypothetical protein